MENQEHGLMAHFEKDAHSFVIRIWREHRVIPTGQAEWRGWISHVQSGHRHYFRNVTDIANIITQYLENLPSLDDVFKPVQSEVNHPHEREDD
ncbi:MAG: hypothetical protein KC443_02670 [Anaerolineales bacterium]|nr:hypothetical protein [Anaerolineales bacterium]